VIIAFAIFWVVKVINRFQRKEEPPPPPPARSEVLLQEIRDALVARPPDQKSLWVCQATGRGHS
jgi:large conductance mechanosensitive channel